MEKKIGKITHFFAKPSAAVLKLDKKLKLGDEIHIKGHTTDFTEKVDSIQIEHKEVESAKKGDNAAILVKERVRKGDEVYLLDR